MSPDRRGGRRRGGRPERCHGCAPPHPPFAYSEIDRSGVGSAGKRRQPPQLSRLVKGSLRRSCLAPLTGGAGPGVGRRSDWPRDESEHNNMHDIDDEEIFDGPAVARIRGRVARVDPGREAGEVVLLLAVEDHGFLDDRGEPRPGLHQILRVHARVAEIGCLATAGAAPEISLTAIFHKSRLQLVSIEAIDEFDGPLPDVRLPKRPEERPSRRDGELPAIEDVTKPTKAGWGVAAHSVWRHQVPIHLVWACKRRQTRLVGWEAMAQTVIRQIAEEEGVEVIAVAFEQHSGSHVHLLVRHPGPGTPPTWSWPHFVNRVKSISSRRLRAIDAEFSWQQGYALAAVHGGKQGAEAALAAVKAYCDAQAAQEQCADDAGT